jgi:hypothetical protein
MLFSIPDKDLNIVVFETSTEGGSDVIIMLVGNKTD